MKTPFSVELVPATAIAGSGTGSAQYVNDSRIFVVEEVLTIVEMSGSLANLVTNASLPQSVGPQATLATTPTANLVRAAVSIGQNKLHNAEMPMNFIGPPPGQNGTLRSPWVVDKTVAISATFTNNWAGSSLTPRILLRGYKADTMADVN